MSNVTEPSPAPIAAPAIRPAASYTASAKPRRGIRAPGKLARTLLFVAAGVAVAVWIGRFALHAYRYVKTDNAYVVGHLHQVSPQIDGQVREVLVQDNQTVKAGDALVRLDSAEFQIAVEKAKAGLAQAQAQEAQAAAAEAQARAGQSEARAKVAQAEAQITQAQAELGLAQLTRGRSEQLFQQGGVATQADVDNARSGANAARAGHDAAIANRDAAKAAVVSADSALSASQAMTVAAGANSAAAQAALSDAQRKLADVTITAPAAGRIGNRNVEPGNRVMAGQTLLALVEPEVWIVANFKETQIPRIQAGQEVELTIDALPSQTFHGRIDSLAPASGAQYALLPPDNATGNFSKVVQRVPVKIALEPESLRQLGDHLRVGLSVIVSVRVR